MHLWVQITGDDIERELGLEDENEANRLELGIGNVKVAPELEESDAPPNASSDGGRRRISHTLITPINDGLSDLESVLASGSWYW